MPDSKKLDYIQERVDAVVDVCSKIGTDVALQKAALESHTKQDEDMYAELRRMNDILQSNTESLKEHMSNNALLKDMVKSIDKRLDPIEIDFIEKKAVRKYAIDKIKLAGKIATAGGAIAASWVYIKPFIEHLLNK